MNRKLEEIESCVSPLKRKKMDSPCAMYGVMIKRFISPKPSVSTRVPILLGQVGK